MHRRQVEQFGDPPIQLSGLPIDHVQLDRHLGQFGDGAAAAVKRGPVLLRPVPRAGDLG
jgi:hypothetical protein